MKEHEEVMNLMHIADKINQVHPHLHHIRNRALKRLEEINAEIADSPPVSTVKVPGVPNATDDPQVAAPAPAEDGTPAPTSTTIQGGGAPGPQASAPTPVPPALATPQTANTEKTATGTPADPAPEPPSPAEAPATPLRRI